MAVKISASKISTSKASANKPSSTTKMVARKSSIAKAAVYKLSSVQKPATAQSAARPSDVAPAACNAPSASSYVGTPLKVVQSADREFETFFQKYAKVDAEITAARERRRAAHNRNARARACTFGDLCELTAGRAKFARDNGMTLAEADELLASRDFSPMLFSPIPPSLAFDAARALRKAATLRIDRIRHRLMRPAYYEREKARRQALAEKRRMVARRTTMRSCPTKDEVLDAWIRVKESPVALLRFGGLLEDLECYVDNSLLRDETGTIIGRKAGIKGWLVENLPALALKYKTVMAYKAAAKKMRQVAGMEDPTPLASVLPPHGIDGMENSGNQTFQEKILSDYGADKIYVAGDVGILRARAVCLEVLEQVGDGTRRTTALVRRLDELTSPDRIEDANMLRSWREKYECEITVRTRDIWAKRLGRQLEKWAG